MSRSCVKKTSVWKTIDRSKNLLGYHKVGFTGLPVYQLPSVGINRHIVREWLGGPITSSEEIGSLRPVAREAQYLRSEFHTFCDECPFSNITQKSLMVKHHFKPLFKGWCWALPLRKTGRQQLSRVRFVVSSACSNTCQKVKAPLVRWRWVPWSPVKKAMHESGQITIEFLYLN